MQAISVGFPNPNYLNANASAQETILSGAYSDNHALVLSALSSDHAEWVAVSPLVLAKTSSEWVANKSLTSRVAAGIIGSLPTSGLSQIENLQGQGLVATAASPAIQAISIGFPSPNYINETGTQQVLLPGVYLNPYVTLAEATSVPVEWAGVVSAFNSVPAEEILSSLSAVLNQIEALWGLRTGSAYPIIQAINVGFPNPNYINETKGQQTVLIGAYLDTYVSPLGAHAPVEWLQSVAPAHPVTAGWIGFFTPSISSFEAEYVQDQRLNQTTPVEVGFGVDGLATSHTELTQNVELNIASLIEIVGRIRNVLRVVNEFLCDQRSVSRVPIEFVKNVHVAMTVIDEIMMRQSGSSDVAIETMSDQGAGALAWLENARIADVASASAVLTEILQALSEAPAALTEWIALQRSEPEAWIEYLRRPKLIVQGVHMLGDRFVS